MSIPATSMALQTHWGTSPLGNYRAQENSKFQSFLVNVSTAYGNKSRTIIVYLKKWNGRHFRSDHGPQGCIEGQADE